MIDQEKTGNFIAQIRKTRGLTQKELADKLSLSDKTISKWETGHGMPDVSVIPELCELLQITANELLAGESLDSSDSFNKKAEENIMELMKEKETALKNSRWTMLAGLAGLVFVVLYIILYECGSWANGLLPFIDFLSFLCVAGITLMVLIISGNIKAFFSGIIQCFKKAPARNSEEISSSIKALRLATVSNMLAGLFGTILGMVLILGYGLDSKAVGPNIAVALVTLFYAVIFDIILIAFRGRLEKNM